MRQSQLHVCAIDSCVYLQPVPSAVKAQRQGYAWPLVCAQGTATPSLPLSSGLKILNKVPTYPAVAVLVCGHGAEAREHHLVLVHLVLCLAADSVYAVCIRCAACL
jgi:hypothetical protein